MEKQRFYSEMAQDALERSAVFSRVEKTAVSKKIELSYINLHDFALAKSIGKKRGVYFTFDCKVDLFRDEREKKRLIKALAGAIRQTAEMLLPKSPVVLVVGLGNEGMTADALGPQTASMVSVTRHLLERSREAETLISKSLTNINSKNDNSKNDNSRSDNSESMQKEVAAAPGKQNNAKSSGERRNHSKNGRALIAAISPNVLGETGVQSFDVVRGVCDRIKPDLVVLVDTLCTSRPERLYSSFQLTTAGISPGSGVGEKRPGFDQNSLLVPVLAIGVPLVANVGEVMKDALTDYCKRQNCALNYSYIEQIIRGKLKGNVILAPKEIDYVVTECARIIASSINQAFL